MPGTFDRSTESAVGQAYRRESFWLDSVDESLDPLPSLEEELRGDVVIVGAGFTGLWTAYFLKQAAPDLEIVMLEKEIAGFGASGRNGGACSAWWDTIFGWLRDPGRVPPPCVCISALSTPCHESARSRRRRASIVISRTRG